MRYVILVVLFSQIVSAQGYKKIIIDKYNQEAKLCLTEIGVDHIHALKDGAVELFVSDDEYKIVQKSGISHQIIIDDWYKYYKERNEVSNLELQSQLRKTNQTYGVNGFDYGSMGGFFTLDEVISKLDEMRMNYPNLITEKSSIGTTHENRDIWFVKISDNPEIDEDEPEVLYTALHHAREPESMMQLIYFMFYLLDNYGTDEQVTYLVNNRELYFIPVVNPDGYEYNYTTNPNGGGMWRKNRRNNGNGTFGVDLNRNYGPQEYWNAPNGGSSTTTSSDTYRGESPFSEPETYAIREFLFTHQIRAALNYHTYGNWLIFPYGALAKETPDSALFRMFAKEMTQFNNYVSGTDMQTVGYTTRGNSDDYFYDGDMTEKGKIFAMTPEVGSSFWPSQTQIIPLAEENIFPNLYYAWIAGGFSSISDIMISQSEFNAGDTVHISVSLSDKGLESFGEFSVKLNNSSEFVEILDGETGSITLARGQEVFEENEFAFIIADNLPSRVSINLTLDHYKDGFRYFSLDVPIEIRNPSIVYSNIFNSFVQKWSALSNSDNLWAQTENDFFSSPSSVTDSKGGNYSPNSSNSMELKENINLAGIDNPYLTFQTKFEIEQGWDYGQCLISSDGGSSWLAVGGRQSTPGSGSFQPVDQPVYSGFKSDWVLEEIDLEEYKNQQILIKFTMNTDSFVENDGWYIDDLQIVYYDSVFTSVSNDAAAPDDFSLYQNYPNPFNPSTKIKYSVPAVVDENFSSTTNVSLIVYDMLGRQISLLVNENKSPGIYEVDFNANPAGASHELSSGVYFYKLIAGNKIDVKKMILIR